MEHDDLYGLPLEQFTDKRNELARELRRSGQREQAAAVSKLRKPSVTAWAVNQLVRTQRRDLDELVKAGDELKRAQADLLANRGDAATLRRAVDAERAAVTRLTDKARGLLNADGHELTPVRLEQVAETLHAAALDSDARASVQGGCLERELRHIGLGDLGAASGTSRVAGPAGPRGRRDARRGARATELDAARRAELEAGRRLARAVKELEKAAARRDRAAQQLRDAEATFAGARTLAAEAEREHRQAKGKLDRAEGR
jgi:hypothetical protein